MKKSVAVAIACLAAASSLLPQVAMAQRFHDQERYMGRYCSNHAGDPDCYSWNHHRDRWDDARYHRWYGHHRHDFGPGDAAAAIFGFAAGAAAGAITGSINGASAGSHEAACSARYRSYDPGSDTFMGYDGERHQCML
jgi:hypothetical protein